MEIEDQVCNLELAKRLRKLRLKQESHFYWKIDQGQPYLVAHNSRYMASKGVVIASAFSVAELGKMLPTKICDAEQFLTKTPRQCYRLWTKFEEAEYADDGITDTFQLGYGGTIATSTYEKNEADARARMLIYLLENDLTLPSQRAS